MGLGKAYNRHVSSKWVPFEEGVHQEREDLAAGKTSKGKGKGKGKGKEEVVRKSGWWRCRGTVSCVPMFLTSTPLLHRPRSW